MNIRGLWARVQPTVFVLLSVGLTILGVRYLPYLLGKQLAEVALLEAQDPEMGYKMACLATQFSAKASDQPCVVMLGASDTSFSFNPGCLRHSSQGAPQAPVIYNLGILNGGPMVQLIMLRRMLGRGIRPDLILVEAESRTLFHSVSYHYNEHFNLEITRVLPEDLDIFKRYDTQWTELRSSWGIYQLAQWWNRRHRINTLKIALWEKVGKGPAISTITDQHGWNGKVLEIGGRKRVPVDVINMSSAEAIGAFSLEPIDPKLVAALNELLGLCRREHITTALVRMPQPTHFRTKAPPEFINRFDKIYRKLAQDNDATLVDGRAWVPDEEFYDIVHVSVAGSEQFTRELDLNYLQAALSRHARRLTEASGFSQNRQ